jgi:hypothetical protein
VVPDHQHTRLTLKLPPHHIVAEVPNFSDLGDREMALFEARPWRLFRTVESDSVPSQARRLLPLLHLLNRNERFALCRFELAGLRKCPIRLRNEPHKLAEERPSISSSQSAPLARQFFDPRLGRFQSLPVYIETSEPCTQFERDNRRGPASQEGIEHYLSRAHKALHQIPHS